MTEPSEELRSAMPEETKPVEREAFDEFARTELAAWLSPYSEDLEEYMGEIMQAAWLAWQARGRVADAVAKESRREFRREAHIARLRALKGRE